jgi:hypothetical protein
LERAGNRLAAEWFGLIVSNAFVAWVSAIVLASVPGFSYTALLWGWLVTVLAPARSLVESVIGSSATGYFQRWMEWYGENSMKFNFWLLYVAGICDDLGLPNLKTLARYSWRRWMTKSCKSPSASSSSSS